MKGSGALKPWDERFDTYLIHLEDLSVTRSRRQPGREYSVSIPRVHSPCRTSAASALASDGNHTQCGRDTEPGQAHSNPECLLGFSTRHESLRTSSFTACRT